MKKSQELQLKLKAAVEKQKAIIETAKTDGNRDFNAEEQKSFNDLDTEIESLEKQIANAQKVEAAVERAAKLSGKPVDPKPEKRKKPFSIIRALNAARSGNMDDDMRALHEKGVAEMQVIGKDAGDNGIILPSEFARGISVGDDSGTKGGELVDTTHQLVDGLFPKLTIEDLGATVMTGLTGDLKLVAGSDMSFSWVDETEDAGSTDATFTGPTLKPKTLRGEVLISTKWLAQTSPSAEAYVMNLIRRAVGTAFVKAAIAGTGTKEPVGIFNIAGVNVKTTATPNWASVVELESAIEAENATDKTLAYLMRPELKGKFKTTSKDSGSGIFVIEGKELNGYGYQSSTLVPKLNDGTNDTYPLIFGDFSQLFIGQWGGIKLLVDPYTKARSGQVAVVVELFGDVQVANPKAFAINKSLVLS